MYFVDRKLIEERLQYIETLTDYLYSDSRTDTTAGKLAFERAAHMTVETMMDVGNQMIDGFIMRDPGSFEDIVAILLDEKVVTKEEADSIEKLLPLRKKLLQDYTRTNWEELTTMADAGKQAVESFPSRVRTYLTNELGPVSAFLPEEEDRS
ncbi:DUF86 domain-containing protein [Alkalicoccus luteus]|uniref:DUF86 domain-containing protein n=1 Tax=Alkalicoccus luteus TaxID=1237094 RepID=A0A969PSI1_9BACI|nr:DUF86 domain-containing protein [Alkalicoccus luteus]NJP38279.1 DUF86 domain-containing protein [Alkalicoccus luteus]